MWNPKYFHEMTKNRLYRTMSGSASQLRMYPSAPIAVRIWSRSPFGRRIWRQTTPVTTSDRMYGAKNSVRNTPRPGSLALSSTARPSANGIWSSSDRTMRMPLWRIALAEQIVRPDPAEVVDPDEVGGRSVPVPVVEAVARALGDRVDHEGDEERDGGEQEGDDRRPRDAALELSSTPPACGPRGREAGLGLPPHSGADGGRQPPPATAVMAAAASSGVASPANSSAVWAFTSAPTSAV